MVSRESSIFLGTYYFDSIGSHFPRGLFEVDRTRNPPHTWPNLGVLQTRQTYLPLRTGEDKVPPWALSQALRPSVDRPEDETTLRDKGQKREKTDYLS